MELIWVPVSDPKVPSGYTVQKQPILFPHRLVSYLFDTCQLQIPDAAVGQFWDNAMAVGEPYARPESRHRVPLGFYGDAAQLITKVKLEKLLCLWINLPLFRPRSIRYSRFLVWSCDNSLLYKNRTVNTVLRWITWSLNCLFEGKNPMMRPGNQPLASQSEQKLAGTWLTQKHYQFQVVEIRGDWEFHKMVWQFKCSWKGGVNVGICFRCPAMTRCNDPGLLYWNIDEDASWSQQEFDTTDYVCQRLPSQNIWCLIYKLRHNHFSIFLMGWIKPTNCNVIAQPNALAHMSLIRNQARCYAWRCSMCTWSSGAPCTSSTWGCWWHWMEGPWISATFFIFPMFSD